MPPTLVSEAANTTAKSALIIVFAYVKQVGKVYDDEIFDAKSDVFAVVESEI